MGVIREVDQDDFWGFKTEMEVVLLTVHGHVSVGVNSVFAVGRATRVRACVALHRAKDAQTALSCPAVARRLVTAKQKTLTTSTAALKPILRTKTR